VPKKNSLNITMPGDVGHSFEQDDFLLNYRPKIEFVEPVQEFSEPPLLVEEETIDSSRDRTQSLIDGYRGVVGLIDIAQQKIDLRVKAAGGLSIRLDPVKDQHVISAMKRRFPDKADSTIIDYEDYKQVVDCVNSHGPILPTITTADLRAAKADPLRTDFGGVGNQNGENRPEISSATETVAPIDLDAFKKGAVIALFALLYPLIKKEDKIEILQHLVTAPHNPV
jgi:hypothetical protein